MKNINIDYFQNDLTNEEMKIYTKYKNILLNHSKRKCYSSDKNLSHLFIPSPNGVLYWLNEKIRKVILDKFIFGIKFCPTFYKKDGREKGALIFKEKDYGIFTTDTMMRNFISGLYIGYSPKTNRILCSEPMKEILVDFFRYFHKDVNIFEVIDPNIYRLFEYDLNWFSKSEINELYKKLRKDPNTFSGVHSVSNESLLEMLKKNGYKEIHIDCGNKFIPLEERKNYNIIEKGGKKFYIKNGEK